MNPSLQGAVPVKPVQSSAIPQVDNSASIQVDPSSANFAPEAPLVNKPNFFERLLPTAGGILGGIVGSPLGFLGGAAGAGAGGALGQELENKLTGQHQSDKTAAAENAVGMGVGGILGKGVSFLAGRVFAPAAENLTSKLVAGQAKNQIEGDVAKYLTEHGVTDLKQAGQMADVLTGGAEGANADLDNRAILNKFVENTLANDGPAKVNVTDLTMPPQVARTSKIGESVALANNNLLQKSITDNALTSGEANAVRSRVSALADALPQDAAGATDSLSALNFQRGVARLAQDNYQHYLDSGRNNSSFLNLYKTYSGLSNAIKDRLGLNQIVVNPEDKAALADNILKYGSEVNPKAAAKLANTIRTSDNLTLADVRGLEQNWVTVKGALQKVADMANRNFGTSTGDLARATLPIAGSVVGVGGKKSLLGAVGGLATASPSADARIASVLDTAAKGAQGKAVQQVLPSLIKAGSIAVANAPNMVNQEENQNNANISAGIPMNPNQPQNQNILQQLYSQLLAQEQAAPTVLGPQVAPLLNSLAPTIQKQQLAVPSIESALGTYSNAGGPQGLGGGFLSRLSGLFSGTPASTYNAESVAAAAQLASVLGISPEQAAGLLPALTQTQGTAAPQIGGIQSILGSLGAVPAQ